jgi:hypothetical protein
VAPDFHPKTGGQTIPFSRQLGPSGAELLVVKESYFNTIFASILCQLPDVSEFSVVESALPTFSQPNELGDPNNFCSQEVTFEVTNTRG